MIRFGLNGSFFMQSRLLTSGSEWVWALVLALGVLEGVLAQAAAEGGKKPLPIDFNRDIRPIFSDHCYACHGPDEKTRKAGLRLDLKEDAFKTLKSNERAIVPGDLSKSTLIQRITTSDGDDVMPPAKGGKPLSPSQIEKLKRWVTEGAEWKGHWAYIKPEPSPLPEIANKDWARNEIDRFVAHKLELKGLKPSQEADRARLLRRVSLDLTGIPPTIEELDAFLADKDSKAYEKVVDRLLGSEHYGERMAQGWLDLARYGETQGYHHDAHRDMFHWRDWVIQAFNKNLPFDQFTTEQLAGDLLPNPTREQLVATGFQRNEMTTSEGGAIPEEYAVKYVVGRVDTASRVWLGTSMACAECHDHKYDPISQKDYYRFFAYFNTIDEHGMDQSANPQPRAVLSSKDQEQRLDQYQRELAALEAAQKTMFDPPHEKHDSAQKEWESKHRVRATGGWTTLQPINLSSTGGSKLAADSAQIISAAGKNPDRDVYEITLQTFAKDLTGIRLETLPSDDFPRKSAGRGDNGEFVLTRIESEARSLDPAKVKAALEEAGKGEWSVLRGFMAVSRKEGFEKDFGPERAVDLAKAHGGFSWVRSGHSGLNVTQDLGGTNGVTYLYQKLQSADRLRLSASLTAPGPFKMWLNGALAASRSEPSGEPAKAQKISLILAPGENHLLVKSVHESEAGSLAIRLGEEAVTAHPITLAAAAADYSQSGYAVAGALDNKVETGWAVGGDTNQISKAHTAWFRADQPFGFAGGTEIRVRLTCHSPQPRKNLGRFRIAVSTHPGLQEFFDLPDNLKSALVVIPEALTQGQKDELRRHYRRHFVAEAKQLSSLLDAKRGERDGFQNAFPMAMIMKEASKPKDTFLLVRGEYNTRGEKVAAGVPGNLFAIDAELPQNRLGLARWLTHPDHPLTSRVIMNQYWQKYFGTGIVKTSEDFGSQGEWPSHPELLDWLATEFVRRGWDIKAMQKLIVMSATYRQSAVVEPSMLDADPEARLLGRFPRQRLEAEAVRDVALAASALLNPKVGGPSVFPYQPPGLWEQVAFEGTRSWTQSQGTENYRRGLYTYWRRSVPYASFVTFDAPSRETCTIRRPRTNTPLQALALMNDPVYVEAARALGLRIMTKGGKTLDEKIRYAARVVLTREPTKKELALLQKAYRKELKEFERDRASANKLIHVGANPPPVDVDVCVLAAWTVVGNILLNLDETINKG